MNPINFDLRRYIFFETIIVTIVNIVLGVIAASITFHGREWINVFGSHGLIINAIPQTFMGVLMTAISVILITGSRMQQGKCGEVRPRHPLLKVIAMALLMAITITIICVALMALILPKVDPGGMSYYAMLGFEGAYSAVLAAIIAPLILLRLFRKSAFAGRSATQNAPPVSPSHP